jgi:hypothetical protein
MAIELLDLVYTLAAGVVLVSSIEIALWASLGHTVFQWLHFRDRFENPGRLALVVILVFIFGVVAEDLSKALVGKSPLMPSEQHLRTGRLFEAVLDGDQDAYEPRLLAIEYARIHAFEAFAHAGSAPSWLSANGSSAASASNGAQLDVAVNAWLKNRSIPLDKKLVDSVAPSTYYSAKNLSYLEPTLFEELTRIERRITFGRCAAIGSLVGLVVLLTGIVANLLAFYLQKLFPESFRNFLRWSRTKLWRRQAHGPVAQDPADTDETIVLPTWGRCLVFVVALVPLYVVGAVLYESESLAYNDRVFGYGLVLHAVKKTY